MHRFYRSLFLLVALSLLTYLLGNDTVVLWDRDEPRYAQTSRQMLDSGDWIVPRLLDEPREKKPAMIYWLQAISMSRLGSTVFAARLPSAVLVTATVMMVALAVRRRLGEELALLAAAVLASSLLVIIAAKLAITDGVLLLFATAAQLSLFAIINGDRRWRVFIGFGIAQGLALLTKGPVVPAITSSTMLAAWILKKISPSPGMQEKGGEQDFGAANVESLSSLEREDALDRRTGTGRLVFGLLTAIALAALIILPWWIAIEHRAPGWTWRVLHNEVLNRAATPQEGHRGPPGFYLLTIWGTFLPWSVLLPAAMIHAWRERGDPPVRFALAAILGPWLLFECSATKLVHYLLPIYPALGFLVARWLLHRGWRRGGFGFAGGTLICFAAMYAGIVPRIPELRLSKRLAEALIADGATVPGQVRMIDYKENSLAFYQGGTIRPESENNFLLTHPPDAWPRWLVLSNAIWRRMPPDVQSKWTILRTVHGWNLAGRDADKRYVVDVHVLRRKD